MAHFAQIDANNIVVRVVVVHNNDAPDEATGIAFLHGLFGEDKTWLQCSYNNNIRKQYPGPGYSYNGAVFIAPQPYPSWTLDANHDWQPPTSMPVDGEWLWDENQTQWIPA